MKRPKNKPFPPAPEGLSERSARLWAAVGPNNAPSVPRQVLLEEALRTLDRLDEVKAAASSAGLVTVTEKSGMHHVSPLLKAEVELRRAFLKAWTSLGLPWRDTEEEGF